MQASGRSGRGMSVRRGKPLFNGSGLLQDRIVTESSNLRLWCSLTADDSISIEWLKDGEPLNESDSRIHTSFQNGEAILDISAVRTSDTGQYTCRAFNDYGESVCYSQVTVFRPTTSPAVLGEMERVLQKETPRRTSHLSLFSQSITGNHPSTTNISFSLLSV